MAFLLAIYVLTKLYGIYMVRKFNRCSLYVYLVYKDKRMKLMKQNKINVYIFDSK